MYRESDARGPEGASRRHDRFAPWRLLGASLLLAILLAACGTGPGNGDGPPVDDGEPPNPSGAPSVVVVPNDMNGVTMATVQVGAEGGWRLTIAGNATIAAAATLAPASGSGDALANLTIDPSGLDRLVHHTFDVRLEAGGEVRSARVTFSFPDVQGQVMRADERSGGSAVGGAVSTASLAERPAGTVVSPAGSSAVGSSAVGSLAAGPEPAAGMASDPGAATGTADGTAPATGMAGAPPGVLHPLRTDPPAGDAIDLTRFASPEGTVTLLVGLQAADRGLAAASLPGEPAAAALSALAVAVSQLAGATVESRFDAAGLAFVEVPAAQAAEAAARLRGAQGVRYVELPVPIYPYSNDEFRHLQWNLDAVGAEQLWPSTRGDGVTIAILDNGFYPNHPDLAGNVVGQYDAGDQRSSVGATRAECGTHGTHVAGIAAAVADNGIGVAGAAPGASLYLVDLDYDSRPGCPMDSTSLVRGLQHVLNGGAPLAQIVNMSLGSRVDLGQGTRDALIAAERAGIILIGAAGNTQCVNGKDTFEAVSYPAAYPEVWAVAATAPGNVRSCYSHVGSELFIAAPGGDSGYPADRFDAILSTDYDAMAGRPLYDWMEGTSMAAPMVAGIVALLKSAVPAATVEQIRRAIIDSALDLGASGKDNLYGHGLIQAPGAYAALVGGEPPPPPPPPPPDVQLYLRIDAPGYPDLYPLQPDGIFTIQDLPPGPVTIAAGSDPNGNGVLGEPGEYFGQTVVEVRFDERNQAFIELELR